MSYSEAATALGVSTDSIRTLVGKGVLDRPEWSRTEIRSAIVTTVSVYRAAGWPIRPLTMVVPGEHPVEDDGLKSAR